MVIATDVQGAEVAKPWVEKAGGTYRALLDQDNTIGNTFGVKYVPVGILIDEYGRLVKDVASVNIGDHAFRQDLERWATEGMPDGWSADKPVKRVDRTPEEEEADARFQLAVVLLKRGKKEQAIAEFQAAMLLDPQNWLIRKQLWAIQTPDAFYADDVDYSWQKAQLEREQELIEK